MRSEVLWHMTASQRRGFSLQLQASTVAWQQRHGLPWQWSTWPRRMLDAGSAQLASQLKWLWQSLWRRCLLDRPCRGERKIKVCYHIVTKRNMPILIGRTILYLIFGHIFFFQKKYGAEYFSVTKGCFTKHFWQSNIPCENQSYSKDYNIYCT